MIKFFKFLSFKKRSTQELLEFKNIYRDVFLNSLGKKVLLDLMRESKLFSNNYAGDSLEFLEGKRTLLYYILHMVYQDQKDFKDQQQYYEKILLDIEDIQYE